MLALTFTLLVLVFMQLSLACGCEVAACQHYNNCGLWRSFYKKTRPSLGLAPKQALTGDLCLSPKQCLRAHTPQLVLGWSRCILTDVLHVSYLTKSISMGCWNGER